MVAGFWEVDSQVTRTFGDGKLGWKYGAGVITFDWTQQHGRFRRMPLGKDRFEGIPRSSRE